MTPPTKFFPGTRAFTLIEMMISMAMLSMVIGVVFAGVSGAQRATLFAANYPLGQMHLADFISMDAARGATIQATAGGVASTLPLTLTVPDIYGPGQIAQAPVRTAITEEKVKGKKFTSWQSLTRKWTLSYGGTPKRSSISSRGRRSSAARSAGATSWWRQA